MAQTLFKLLDDFKKLSGLEVNPIKTEGMRIGSSRENKRNPFVLNGQVNQLKPSGFIILMIKKLLHEKYFIENLDSVKKTYKYLVCKKSLSLWKGNNNKIPDCPKICLCIVIIYYPHGSYPRTELADF